MAESNLERIKCNGSTEPVVCTYPIQKTSHHRLPKNTNFQLPEETPRLLRPPSVTTKSIAPDSENYVVWTDSHCSVYYRTPMRDEINNHESWIEKFIKIRICCKFIPSREPNVCKCGTVKNEHYELGSLDQRPRRNRYGGSQIHTVRIPCNTYGVLDFQGIGVVNQAPYCRMADDISPQLVYHLLSKVWKLPTPSLLISVLGGSNDFELQSKIKQAVKNGLIKAAETTGAWIITNGLNCGASKEVGSALKNAYKRNSKIPCIGITPWGIVQGRDQLVGCDKKVRYYSRKAEVGKLNAHHSYFLLADNGRVGCDGIEVNLRRSLENYVSGRKLQQSAKYSAFVDIYNQSNASSIHKVPLICVVIEGGVSLIRTMYEYLSEVPPVPVVVCDGTGRAADIIAFAHRIYDERRQAFPECVKSELLHTIQCAFHVSAEDAICLFRDLIKCFDRAYEYISIYCYGSYADGVSDIDVNILSALLRGHSDCALDQFKLTMSWNRPDLADKQIFRIGKVWERSDLYEAMMLAFKEDKVDFVKLLLNNGVDVQKFLTFEALEQLYNECCYCKSSPSSSSSPSTPLVPSSLYPQQNSSTQQPLPLATYQLNNSMLSKLLNEVVKSKSVGEDTQKVSLIDLGYVIELLIGGVYRSAYCRKNFKFQYKIYQEQQQLLKNNEKEKAEKEKMSSVAHIPKRGSAVQLSSKFLSPIASQVSKLTSTTANTENDNLIENKIIDEIFEQDQLQKQQQQPFHFVFEYPFHELFVWAVLSERQEMAKFLWQQSPEPLAKALIGAQLYFSMSEEAEKDDSDLGSADKLKHYGDEFLELALSLLQECYSCDGDLTCQLLTYELHQWSKQTCLSIAVNASAKKFVSHNACQLLINDLWMGGLKINKNSNFKVIACILFPPLLFLMEFKTAEQLRLMPQTAEEHADDDPLHYDSDSTSSSSSSSSSSSDENAGGPTFLVADEDSNNVWDKLRKRKKNKRRRHKSTSAASAITTNDQFLLQAVNNDGSQRTEKFSFSSSGKINSDNKIPNDVAVNLEEQIISQPPPSIITLKGTRSRKKNNGAAVGFKSSSSNADVTDTDNQDTEVKSINSSSRLNKEISLMKKFYEFFNAPITKFWSHTMAFFIFMALYHWMILVKLPEKPDWIEIYVICCIVSMSLEVIREITVSEPVKWRGKVVVWFSDPWNIIDFSGCSVFLIAAILRFIPDTMPWGRWLYCLDVIFWYAKLLEVFSVNKSLGPFVQIIAQMMLDMISFLVFMFLVLSCYGTVRQAILHPNEPFRWKNIRDIFLKPYFMIYGEVYATEIAPECGTDHSPECVTGHWIEPALMSIYLLVENILLVNLLIAVFNNTYNVVRSMTKEVWKYQRYYVIMHHETKSVVPPPITVVSYFYILIRFIIKRRKIRAYDKGLKLFLSTEEQVHLNEFESSCLSNFLREKESSQRKATEERIKLVDERTESAMNCYSDMNEKILINRLSLQNVELKLDEINRQTNEKLEHIHNVMKELLMMRYDDCNDENEDIESTTKHFTDSHQFSSQTTSLTVPQIQTRGPVENGSKYRRDDSYSRPPPALVHSRNNNAATENAIDPAENQSHFAKRRGPKHFLDYSFRKRLRCMSETVVAANENINGQCNNRAFSSNDFTANLFHNNTHRSRMFVGGGGCHMMGGVMRDKEYSSITDHIELHLHPLENYSSSSIDHSCHNNCCYGQTGGGIGLEMAGGLAREIDVKQQLDEAEKKSEINHLKAIDNLLDAKREIIEKSVCGGDRGISEEDTVDGVSEGDGGEVVHFNISPANSKKCSRVTMGGNDEDNINLEYKNVLPQSQELDIHEDHPNRDAIVEDDEEYFSETPSSYIDDEPYDEEAALSKLLSSNSSALLQQALQRSLSTSRRPSSHQSNLGAMGYGNESLLPTVESRSMSSNTSLDTLPRSPNVPRLSPRSCEMTKVESAAASADTNSSNLTSGHNLKPSPTPVLNLLDALTEEEIQTPSEMEMDLETNTTQV